MRIGLTAHAHDDPPNAISIEARSEPVGPIDRTALTTVFKLVEAARIATSCSLSTTFLPSTGSTCAPPNPIESTFATVRHRTIRSKGCLSDSSLPQSPSTNQFEEW